MKKKKAVVLLSGGMDSAVALWWARRRGWNCFALAFDYGQRHRREIKSAQALAKHARVPLVVGSFRLPWSGSTLTDKSSRLPQHALKNISKRIPSTYVPGRNTVFLSFATSYADQICADAIVIGANAIDYSGYPDCRPAYLSSFEKVARLGTKRGTEQRKKIKVIAPLLQMTKCDIVRTARRLRVPLELTWSCYQGGKTPCRICDSCRLRAKGFEEAHELDVRQ